MSQATLEIIQGLAQAAAECYDGASDDEGQPLDIGLKREKGHPVLDSRQIDGFKVRVEGTMAVITYHSEIKLKDVYATKFEDGLEQTMADIASHLKKKYKKITGKALRMSPAGEVDAIVEKISKVRVHVVAKKVYKLGGMVGAEDKLTPSADKLENKFKNFLSLGGWGQKATRRG